jgi:hypothetical protein
MDSSTNKVNLQIIPFIYPFINSDDFPIEFKVLESWSYNGLYTPIFRLNYSFFEEINNCKTLKKFKKQYRTASSLMNMNKNMSEILNAFANNRYYDFLTLSECFPFKITNSSYKKILGQINDHDKSYLYLFILAYDDLNVPIPYNKINFKVLGDFELIGQAFIFRENFRQILVSNLMHLELPTISISELNQCFDQYHDIKYRYITAIDMMDDYSGEIYTKFVKSFESSYPSFKISGYKFNTFLYPYPNDRYIKKDKWFISNDFITKDIIEFNNDLAIGEFIIRHNKYIVIYSNMHPNLIPEVAKFLDVAKFIAYSTAILEVKKSF